MNCKRMRIISLLSYLLFNFCILYGQTRSTMSESDSVASCNVVYVDSLHGLRNQNHVTTQL